MPPETRSPAQAAAAAILETIPPVMRAIRARMREGRPVGISVPQFRALLYVRRNPGTGLSGVAEHLGTSLPAASELVARLVQRGLVAREADPASRRRIRLAIRPSGADYLGVAQAGTTAWLVGRLEDEDPGTLAALVEALGHLNALVGGTAVPDPPRPTGLRGT